VLQRQLRDTGFDIPHLDGVVARGTGQNILGGGVEEHVADLPESVSVASRPVGPCNVPHVPAELGDRSYIGGLLGVCVESEVLGHLPDEDLNAVSPACVRCVWGGADLAIVRGRRDERVVEGAPARGSALLCWRLWEGREGVPVGVEDGSRVSAEEGKRLGRTTALLDGDDGEGATTASLPVDRDVLRVGLREVSGVSGGGGWSRARRC
jgi:hypothetical protein